MFAKIKGIFKKRTDDSQSETNEQFSVAGFEKKHPNKIEKVVAEMDFLRYCFNNSMKTNVVLVVALGILVATDVTRVVTHEATRETFFVTNQNNQFIPINPVGNPLPDGDVITWASESLKTVYTLEPLSYRETVSNVYPKLFATDSLLQYRNVIASRLKNISEKGEGMTSIAAAPPVIINKGVKDNRYYWQVMQPIQIVYKTGTQVASEYRRIVMNIVRADQARYPSGLMFTSIDQSEPINAQSFK